MARCNPAARDQFGCVGNGKTQPAVARRLCAVQVRIRATPTMRTQLERDDVLSNRHLAPFDAWSMIFSENRYPLFGIMLKAERKSATLEVRVRVPAPAPIRLGSSAVERRVEGARVGGSIPSPGTMGTAQGADDPCRI